MRFLKGTRRTNSSKFACSRACASLCPSASDRALPFRHARGAGAIAASPAKLCPAGSVFGETSAPMRTARQAWLAGLNYHLVLVSLDREQQARCLRLLLAPDAEKPVPESGAPFEGVERIVMDALHGIRGFERLGGFPHVCRDEA